jgi:hypothetical protein
MRLLSNAAVLGCLCAATLKCAASPTVQAKSGGKVCVSWPLLSATGVFPGFPYPRVKRCASAAQVANPPVKRVSRALR